MTSAEYPMATAFSSDARGGGLGVVVVGGVLVVFEEKASCGEWSGGRWCGEKER